MADFLPVADQLAVLLRGAVDVQVKSELEQRLEESRRTGKPLRVKAGFDPTRPDLHVGHAVLLQKMRQFQDLGHTAIFLIGDFTAMVGDPTGQNELRPRLTREDVRKAALTYLEQAYKILDRDLLEETTNAAWLEELKPSQLVELMAKSTVSRMLERNDFHDRFSSNRPIYQHEFLYPLLQGYDSVHLECDVELGGTDQLFNLLVGRDLMQKYGKRPQIVLTVPILEGTDAKLENGTVVGKKMSKSAGNFIGLSEAPLEIHRKVMQIDDDVIFRYFDLLSQRSADEIATLRADRKSGRNPMEIKALFAEELITRLHSKEAAVEGKKGFDAVYSADALPENIPTFDVTTETDSVWIAKALSAAQLVKSTSEGKRLVEQGGVELDQVRVTNAQQQLERGKTYLLRVGSKNRKFAYVNVKA